MRYRAWDHRTPSYDIEGGAAWRGRRGHVQTKHTYNAVVLHRETEAQREKEREEKRGRQTIPHIKLAYLSQRLGADLLRIVFCSVTIHTKEINE